MGKVWFVGYRCSRNCTFLGKTRDEVPAKCDHGHGWLVRGPELIDNPCNVPLGMEEAPPVSPSTVDISTIHEYGLTQKLSNSIRCF